MYRIKRLYSLAHRTAVQLRMCSTSNSSAALAGGQIQPQEVQLPVPWGHIAGKAWGDPLGKPVLALHGWLDNANSFDKLIPLLSSDLYVVALDWPGHGQSSHRPPGCQQYAFSYVADIKYAVDALKWDKFMLLAHSMGTGAASWFAAALPERVEAMVLIEGIGYWSVAEERLVTGMGRALNSLTVPEEQSKNKMYSSWDSVIDRVIQGHAALSGQEADSEKFLKLFNREAAATLASRGTKKTDDGQYYFTRDVRLRLPSLVRVSVGVNNAFVRKIQCPVLLIIAEESYVPFSDVAAKFPDVFGREEIKVVKVPGGHHVHLCSPAVMDGLVDHFFKTKALLPGCQEAKL